MSPRRLVRRLAHSTLARFVAVGVLNTAFSYLLYAALVLARIDYRWALTICSAVTIVCMSGVTCWALKLKANSLSIRSRLC